MSRRLEIAVIGAGVAGLAHAIMLSRLGHKIVIHERYATARPVGSGLLIQPTGLAALDRLGLGASIAALGQRIDRLQGAAVGRRYGRDRVIFDLSYGSLGADWHALAVHRAALHKVLWQGFEASGAAFEPGVEIVAVEEAAEGGVSLVGRQGRRSPIYDLVIDASGARSPIRSWVSGKSVKPFSYGAVWATVPDAGFAPAALCQRYVAAKIMIGHLPIGRLAVGDAPLAALFWSLKPTDHAAWRRGFDHWQAAVMKLWPALEPAMRALGGPDDFTLASYVQFTADRLWRGPVVLTGDAAHCTSPQLGQGANHALIDAVILADVLAASPDLHQALPLYAQARQRHVRFYQQASALLTPFFQSDSRLMAWTRDRTFDRLKLVPYLHAEMLRTLAGIKTGLFTAGQPDAIVNGLRPVSAR